jgi:hypothetical protein
VNGNLFSTPLGRDVLSAHELRTPAVAGKADEVLGYERDGAPGALLPRSIGSRVDDDLAHDAPTGVVGIAARYEEPR